MRYASLYLHAEFRKYRPCRFKNICLVRFFIPTLCTNVIIFTVENSGNLKRPLTIKYIYHAWSDSRARFDLQT